MGLLRVGDAHAVMICGFCFLIEWFDGEESVAGDHEGAGTLGGLIGVDVHVVIEYPVRMSYGSKVLQHYFVLVTSRATWL